MRVLIVHHGQLPHADAPVTGGALRARQHARALAAAGHEVHLLSRAQDGPGGFRSGVELHLRARGLRPDAVLCVQPEEAYALAGLGCPVIVDLYAPRLLEAPFEGKLEAELPALLRAFDVGDVFLASSPQAALHWTGPLALAGLDLRTTPLLVVPIAAPQPGDGLLDADLAEGAPEAEAPLLVGGGVAWPWQDPTEGLGLALAALDAHGAGALRWYGALPALPAEISAHPRFVAAGWLPYPALLRAWAPAWLALDLWAPNPERALASGFRHADQLGLGLPVLTGADTALGALVGPAGAGLASADPAADLRRLLEDGALRATLRAGARALARGPLHPVAAAAPLLRWLEAPARHPRGRAALLDAARLSARAAEAEARAEAAAAAAARAEADAVRTREQLAQAQAQVHELLGTTGRMARALDEVAGFKREAVALLGGQSEHARRAEHDAQREIGLLRADIEKKNAEIAALDELRGRLEADNRGLRAEILSLRQRKGLFLGGA